MRKKSCALPTMLGLICVLVPGIVQAQTPPPPPGQQSTPQKYYIKCSGAAGMAEVTGPGPLITINFQKGDRPANQGLQPGQCTWMDRGLRPEEPSQIKSKYRNDDEARRVANEINRGFGWTFLVFNVDNKYFQATASKAMPPSAVVKKPEHPID